MIEFIEVAPKTPDEEKVGNLAYGTIFTYDKSRYVKVDKHKMGEGLRLSFSNGGSVACNLKLGTLRELRGDIVVNVIDIRAEVSPAIAAENTKDAVRKRGW